MVKDNDYKNLLTLMLNKNQSQRLSNFNDISNHNFFKGFNWDDLLSLKMKPPFIPKVDNNEEQGGDDKTAPVIIMKIDAKLDPFLIMLKLWKNGSLNQGKPNQIKKLHLNLKLGFENSKYIKLQYF